MADVLHFNFINFILLRLKSFFLYKTEKNSLASKPHSNVKRNTIWQITMIEYVLEANNMHSIQLIMKVGDTFYRISISKLGFNIATKLRRVTLKRRWEQ